MGEGGLDDSGQKVQTSTTRIDCTARGTILILGENYKGKESEKTDTYVYTPKLTQRYNQIYTFDLYIINQIYFDKNK